MKRKSEKTERELSTSRTKSQQLATKHEEMTVSQLHCTVAHMAGCCIYEAVDENNELQLLHL